MVPLQWLGKERNGSTGWRPRWEIAKPDPRTVQGQAPPKLEAFPGLFHHQPVRAEYF